MTRNRPRWRQAALAVALTAVTTGCTGGDLVHQRTSVPLRSPVSVGVDIAADCQHPDAVAATDHPDQVGSPDAARVGQLTFHPYPYFPGYPTKIIVHALQGYTQPYVLKGYNCDHGGALHFFYGDSTTLPSPPYTMDQMMFALGEPSVSLPPMAMGDDRGGYVLLTAAGRWLISVAHGGHIVGWLRIDATVQPLPSD